MALARQSPAHTDAASIEASCQSWSHTMGILEQQLARTGAYVAGQDFTLADIPIGLSVNRWFCTPFGEFSKPALPAVMAYYDRLAAREGYRLYGRNGTA
jgi:glutathione S-transferase